MTARRFIRMFLILLLCAFGLFVALAAVGPMFTFGVSYE